MLSEIYRERQRLYDFTYMWNLKDNKHTHKKTTQNLREQVGNGQRGEHKGLGEKAEGN